MKILEMRLLAFGPFTDTVLDFSKDRGNFPIVFGPNEAGKSSALRALQNMFFGIPLRSPDNFHHPHNQLRIGARLTDSDGKEIEFIRRKGLTQTLRHVDDETPMDEADLSRCLGHTNESLFSQMFGIGHDELVSGGREIVSGGGNVGQALFSAGSGLIRLRNVQDRLTDQCKTLFLPSGKKPKINRALSEYKDIRRSQKEAALPRKTWQTHDQALQTAQVRIDIVLQELRELKQAGNRLERIREALPFISRRKEILDELADYGDVPLLPGDFGARRIALETQFKIAENERNREKETIRKIQEQISALSVPSRLLTHAASIEDLQQELGSYRKAALDRPDLAARIESLGREASNRLSEIGDSLSIESARELSLTPTTIGTIQNLSQKYERLTARIESARKNQRQLAARLKALEKRRKSLIQPVDVSSLKTALEEALGGGSLEEQLKGEVKSIGEIEQIAEREIKQQSLWSGTLRELGSLPLPSNENIDSFEDLIAAANNRMDQLTAEKENTEKAILQVTTDLKTLELTQEVPTETDLQAARILRDKGWSLIRDSLEGRENSPRELEDFISLFENTTQVPEAFEKSISQADRIADRLRREADRVNRKGALLAQKDQQGLVLSGLEKDLTAAKATVKALMTQWQALWATAGLVPQSPKEMRAWAIRMQSIRERQGELDSRKATAKGQKAAIDQRHLKLRRSLSAMGKAPEEGASLSELITQAKLASEAQEELLGKVRAIDNEQMARSAEQTEGDADLAGLQEELTAWNDNWRKAVGKIGLDFETNPSLAGAVINSIRDARGKIEESENLRKRIAGIDRDASVFDKKVAELVDQIAPDLKGSPTTATAVAFNARLSDARKSQSRNQTLREQLEKAEQKQSAAENRITDISTQLEALSREAGFTAIPDLPQLEKRAGTKGQLESDLKGVEKRLRDLSAGATVTGFIADAMTVDADGIEIEIETIGKRFNDLDQERSLLDQTIGTEKGELGRMDGSGKAAVFAEEAERLLAGLESDVEQYARLKIASALLTGAIEQYREKHQGPLIERAGELFATMTLGAFQGIRAEYDEKGRPILVGIRPESHTHVGVEGMSDGSADQLYLALRLASLEQYLQSNEPLPFTVDDILLRFDDERAKATLQVLAELSKKTQVIFFTHHHHLVQLAENTPQVSSAISVHRLGQ